MPGAGRTCRVVLVPNKVRSYVQREATGGRALAAAGYTSGTAMTEASCITYCSTGGRNYAYAGIEYASECYCGNTLDSTAAAAPETDCNMGCSGDTAQACGAGSRLTVFRNPNVKPPVSSYTPHQSSHRLTI